MKFDPSLYLVTDRALSLGRDLEWIVTEAVRGGVTMVQLREKDCSTREFVSLGQRLKTILRESHVPLIINDRIDVALAIQADGVHLGQTDMPYAIARQLLGPDKIIGLSVENFEQIKEANRLNIDYIGISPIFSTPTKTDTAAPFGLEGTAKAVQLSVHPTVAIGGIHLDNVERVMATGVNGVAVVSCICSAADPTLAAQQLKAKIDAKTSQSISLPAK